MTKAERKAYNCRNRNGIKEFPITSENMMQLMREMGYKVSMYSEAKDLITAKGWENCAANNPAFSCKVDGVFTVFVADDAADITKAIAHELGHAELGHALDFEKPKEIRLEEDDEANEFVPYFLAPPCYLNGLNIKTLEELEEMHIGIPQITHLTYSLIQEGLPLPRPAINVADAEEMLVRIFKGEKER